MVFQIWLVSKWASCESSSFTVSSILFKYLFLTRIVLLNFKLVFEGVYCLATKPQTTLPSELIMQPMNFWYEHRESRYEQSHKKLHQKYRLLPPNILNLFPKAIFFIVTSFAINMNKDSIFYLWVSLLRQHIHRNWKAWWY